MVQKLFIAKNKRRDGSIVKYYSVRYVDRETQRVHVKSFTTVELCVAFARRQRGVYAMCDEIRRHVQRTRISI